MVLERTLYFAFALKSVKKAVTRILILRQIMIQNCNLSETICDVSSIF